MLGRRKTILLVILFLCLLAYLPQLSNAAPGLGIGESETALFLCKTTSPV